MIIEKHKGKMIVQKDKEENNKIILASNSLRKINEKEES